MLVILLHGYAMDADDLAPLARAMGLPAVVYTPRAPHIAPGRGRAWWAIDEERRASQLQLGPRDLSDDHPPGRVTARRQLAQFMKTTRDAHAGLPLVLAGFSQGGMLACETLLHEAVRAEGLALLSSSCLALSEWQAHAHALQGLPVFVSHGTQDLDLSFAAGERLRDFLVASGAGVRWHAFEGGHEIPFAVWRELKRFLLSRFPPASGTD